MAGGPPANWLSVVNVFPQLGVGKVNCLLTSGVFQEDSPIFQLLQGSQQIRCVFSQNLSRRGERRAVIETGEHFGQLQRLLRQAEQLRAQEGLDGRRGVVKRLSPLKHGDVLVQQEWIALRLIIDLLQQFSVSCLTGRQCLFDQAVTGLHRESAQGENEHGGVVLER